MTESQIDVDASSDITEIPHVVILHERLSRRKSDRYILNIALAYYKIGYKVSILTSEFERNEAITDIRFAGKVALEYCAWWIPKTLLGLLSLSVFRSIWMALKLIVFPPDPKPEVIILDISLIALYILKSFSNYKVFVVETFEDLKNTDACYEHTKLIPTLVEAKWIKLADEIIVETLGFAEILVKSHPSIIKKPRILYPSIDLGLWNEPGIKIQRIIPDLLGDTILFLSVGKFKRASNFKLALDAFEFLLELIDDSAITKRFQLVVAGNCKTLDERFHYSELMASAKQRVCAAQITFLRQLPIIHEKTLIMESAIMIHPAKNDVYSDFVLKAMSLGKPIVATNKGIASKLLVHRLSGVIVEPEPKVIALAMKKLMLNPHLQVFLGDMAKEAFDKSHSFDAFCGQINEIMRTPMEASVSTIYNGHEESISAN
ncbi:alpha-1,3/1,6-mannosyltransferase ALG2-like [Diabrotica undecimpunctata]|uniref:alpha-1,3/1,6-mannosyltransferase ALG2-like n=1 Tax=Diabrotica undecimpunctata TaxID=50387 RepID=UPI003B63C0B5